MSTFQLDDGEKAYVLRSGLIITAAPPPRWVRIVLWLDRRDRRSRRDRIVKGGSVVSLQAYRARRRA